MLRSHFLRMMFVPILVVLALHVLRSSAALSDVCALIHQSISSNSSVYFPDQTEYVNDIEHWALSSTEPAYCSVEPGNAADVSIILKILGNTQTPFAVKGGGHAANPGASSTPGVQIALSRFTDICYDARSKTASIGSGLRWQDVYSALEPFGVTVVGGRVPNVGVAGLSLGGGYSFKSNQYGLTVDTITEFELVKPDGSIVTVTRTSDPELFFGLKGGFNNFGIVTRFTYRTFPQGQVWGGAINYDATNLVAVLGYIQQFSDTNRDPKASMYINVASAGGQLSGALTLFYDGPTPPKGKFDSFLNTPSVLKDISTRSYSSLVGTAGFGTSLGANARFDSVATAKYTPRMVNAILNETQYWGANLPVEAGYFVALTIEPFLPSAFTANSGDSAYPPASVRAQALMPTAFFFGFANATFSKQIEDGVRQSTTQLKNVALLDGQLGVEEAAIYPNYASFETPISRLYGSNVNRLMKLKCVVDPKNVMGLAGGFKIPLAK